jgi:formate-nitrite transporter family protein
MPQNDERPAEKHSAELPPEEQREVQERSAASVHVLHEVIVQEGEVEIRRPSSALAWSGLAAGLRWSPC